MKKLILLIGGNYFPEPTGIGKYNGEMIQWLAEQGNFCTVVTTYPYYPQWKVQPPYEKKRFWFTTETLDVADGQPIQIIRCPHYVPKTPSAITRLLSEFSFFFIAYLAILVLIFRKKFDYIITVAPPFEVGLLGVFYRSIRGGKFLYHIQDLQIDAARDLSMIKSDLIVNLFFRVERFIIRQADCVSTISAGMIQKVKNKCNREVLLFPNWVDTESFYPLTSKSNLKKKFGFKATDKVFLYSGAIGYKQGLEAILETARIVKEQTDIKFAICGSGPYKEHLVKLKDQLNLQNVFFLPLQPLQSFNSFLNMADVHLVIQKAGASDLVLPSKLSAILSVGGVAIVTAQKGTSLHNIMNVADMGIVIEPENQLALVEAVINIKDRQLEEKSRNARRYAIKFLESDKILRDYFSSVHNHQRPDAMPFIKEVIRRPSKNYKLQ